LKLFFKGILHLKVLSLLCEKITLLLSYLLFFIPLLDLINKFVLKLSFLSHFLIVEIAVVVVNLLILLVYSGVLCALGKLLILIGLIFLKLLNLLFAVLPSFLLLVEALLVQSLDDVLPERFRPFLLFDF
jgi:hypothetical protein